MPRLLPVSTGAHWALPEANPHPPWAFDLETLAFGEDLDVEIYGHGIVHEGRPAMPVQVPKK